MFEKLLRELAISPANYRLLSGLVRKIGGKDMMFTPLGKADSESAVGVLKRRFPPKYFDGPLTLSGSKVYNFKTQDIVEKPTDRYGKLLIFSGDGVDVSYGDCGIAPSATETPLRLANKYGFKIPPGLFGVVEAPLHTPFRISALDSKSSFAYPLTSVAKVLNHEDNIKNYRVKTLCNLPPDVAQKLSSNIYSVIDNDKDKERFFEELTSRMIIPSSLINVSLTGMAFEGMAEELNTVTSRHFHPGIRFLVNVTIENGAGVELNFCGVNEAPDDRLDCRVDVPFPKNAISILAFPAYVHHKFRESFQSFSIHPYEGPNITKAVNEGKLSKGFLETATVFSKVSVQNPLSEKLQNEKDDKKR